MLKEIFHFMGNTINYGIPCVFRNITGYYCPGCGGTRAVLSLAEGNIFLSLYYNPIVLYFVFCLIVAGIRLVRVRISKRPLVEAMLPVPYFIVAAAILVINCIVRNILLINMGLEI